MRRLIAGVLVLVGLAARAEPPNYCPFDEPFAPDGVILRVGESYFRTCGTWTDGNWRQFLLDINPGLIPDLHSSYSPSNLRVVENSDGRHRMEASIGGRTDTGTRTFGGVTYRSFESEARGPNGRRNAGTYIFVPDPADVAGIPEHWVTCDGWGRIRSDTLTCSVWVDRGDVVGSLLFIGSDDRGFAFIDHLPWFAQDIVRVLDIADVTDDLADFEGRIEIVD